MARFIDPKFQIEAPNEENGASQNNDGHEFIPTIPNPISLNSLFFEQVENETEFSKYNFDKSVLPAEYYRKFIISNGDKDEGFCANLAYLVDFPDERSNFQGKGLTLKIAGLSLRIDICFQLLGANGECAFIYDEQNDCRLGDIRNLNGVLRVHDGGTGPDPIFKLAGCHRSKLFCCEKNKNLFYVHRSHSSWFKCWRNRAAKLEREMHKVKAVDLETEKVNIERHQTVHMSFYPGLSANEKIVLLGLLCVHSAMHGFAGMFVEPLRDVVEERLRLMREEDQIYNITQQ